MKIRIAVISLGLAALSYAGVDSVPTIHEVHQKAILWFIARPDLGVSRMPSAEELRFSKGPLPSEIISLQGRQYRFKDIQLIGVIKHDPPVAFFMGNKPSPHRETWRSPSSAMEILKDYETRSLTTNEARAIAVMQSDKIHNVIVAGSTPDSAHVVGAIRATTSCLECHDVKKDDLLGAFSYSLELVPEDQVPATGTPVKP